MKKARQPKALITGATGFVGRHLARHLAAAGWAVDILLRPTSDPSPLADIEDLVLHAYDGSGDSVQAAVRASKPDVVFHLATHFLAGHGADDIDPLIEANIRFGAHLLQAMHDAGVSALVNTGTSWQTFNDAPYRPVNFYAATKQAFEDLIAYFTDAGALRAVTLRLFDTYGPDDPRKKLFWALRDAAANGTELQMSPGEQLLDLVYIDDVTAACLQAAEQVRGQTQPGHAVHGVSGGKPQTLKAVVETFARVAGAEVRVNWGGRDYREREVMVPWTQGEPPAGWAPKVGLEEGIRAMLDGNV